MAWRAFSVRPIVAGVSGAALLALAIDGRRASKRRVKLSSPTYCSEHAPPENSISFVQAELTGLHKKGLVQPGEWHLVTMHPPFTLSLVWGTIRYVFNHIRPSVPVRVYNARELEAREGLSKAAFFEKHGFVLLHCPTAMVAKDWADSSPNTLDISNFTGYGMPTDRETPISRIYAKEVEAAVRILLPRARHIELDPLAARRGPGTNNPRYSFAVHQDYGLTDEDWPLADEAWRRRYAGSDVQGFMAINFWRPIAPMLGPVKMAPLCVCSPQSVKMEDVVSINIKWDHMPYVKMLALAHDEDQRWYYYPDMTLDEVLVFKSFQHFKSQVGPELNTCFHTAFNDHSRAPPDVKVEPRMSSEYRVRVWL